MLAIVQADRIRDRKPVKHEITVSYQDNGIDMPFLFLFSDYSTRLADWRKRDEYRVEEIPASGGRGFMLHRDAEIVAKEGPDADEYYGVFLAHNGQDHICSCRGFAAHSRCKHFDAIRGLIEAGHLDEPFSNPAPDTRIPETAPF